jgi:hypothetical protein
MFQIVCLFSSMQFKVPNRSSTYSPLVLLKFLFLSILLKFLFTYLLGRIYLNFLYIFFLLCLMLSLSLTHNLSLFYEVFVPNFFLSFLLNNFYNFYFDLQFSWIVLIRMQQSYCIKEKNAILSFIEVYNTFFFIK